MNTPSCTATYLSVDDALAFVEVWGQGQPVLCIHTAGQSGVQYRHAAAELAQLGYQVIVPDLPGHGRSEPHPSGPVTSLGTYAQWCIRLLEHLGVSNPIVLGCSIGGKIALDIAARLGDNVRAAIAMAANADHGHVNVRSLQRELQDIAAPSRSDRTYFGTLAVVGSTVPDDRRELIARMHCREDPQVSISDLLGWGAHDIRQDLPRITAPTYVIAGTDDLWISAASVQRAAEQIPQGRYLELEGIGHYPMEEMTDFAGRVHQWVRELVGTDHRNATPEPQDAAGALR